MSISAISKRLLELPVAERVALADQLYASVPEGWQRETDGAWLQEAEARSADLDRRPESELSYDQFLAGIEFPKREA